MSFAAAAAAPHPRGDGDFEPSEVMESANTQWELLAAMTIRIVLAGRSGVGKTTMLNMLARLAGAEPVQINHGQGVLI
jgi:ABC-type sugar transport system ATPase subunit